MAGESCNLNDDEAEILKPSSSSASPSHPSPSPPPPPSSSTQPPAPAPALPPSSLFSKPPMQEFPPPERPEPLQTTPAAAPTAAVPAHAVASTVKPENSRPRSAHRCSSCHKKVGLTGFRCRCGELFCARHRYSDTHDCSFDYKAAGRERIAKENPLIRAAKIIRI